MKIKQLYSGADHGGWKIKQELLAWLAGPVSAAGEIMDLGADHLDPDDDYPLFAKAVSSRVSESREPVDQDPTVWGLLLCRSGAGMTILANRYPFVRAVVCRSVEDARHAREHNNANVVVLEGDYITLGEARAVIQAFLTTPFEGGRHARRLRQIEKIAREIKS